VEGVVWDFGNVLIDWSPHRAIAASVGEREAERFLAAFDFAAWNHLCDAGLPWAEALDRLAHETPEWLPHGRAYVDNFPLSLTGPVPGTHELVRELHAAGIRQVGLTNWSRELYPVAPATYDVIGLLDDVVVSGVEGVAKPDAAAFAIAAARAGLPAERLAFVDDSARNIAAAHELGFAALAFTDATVLRAELRRLGLPVRPHP
jgi:2-haloacid dehalogenase